MDSPASTNVEPPVLGLSVAPPKFQPAEGLEDTKILPFNISKFKKAIAERLQAVEDGEKDGENVREWIVFSDFDCSKLKLIDAIQRRYPIRLQLDSYTLVVKMVHPVHEAMHSSLLLHIVEEMNSMESSIFT